MESHKLKKDIMNNKYSSKDKKYLFNKLEEMRNKEPTIYNIETTNACNMKCIMCPRTTRMTRSIETLSLDTFIKIIDQIKPTNEKLFEKWKEFCVKEYNISENDMSENHFFLYIISQVIQLHAYGDPLLDKNIHNFVKLLHDKGFKTYFSCNPANINLEKVEECFISGLDYIKFSIESINDELHKQIRGKKSNFTKSYEDICKLLEIKKKKDYKTTIVITMLDLNQENQKEQYIKLKEYFKDKDVYIYLKSEDTQWYRKDYHGTNSIHWLEICRHPWMSMSIKSNGDVAMCMEDYNNEIVLGNVKEEKLVDIWNGKKYNEFRNDHINLTSNIRCTKECDMKLIGNCL
jgi:radical SAM protein with 4Fe4S-binding SPASM domain